MSGRRLQQDDPNRGLLIILGSVAAVVGLVLIVWPGSGPCRGLLGDCGRSHRAGRAVDLPGNAFVRNYMNRSRTEVLRIFPQKLRFDPL